MGLFFQKEQLLVPASPKECVLQVLPGDHAGQTKMLELSRSLIWKTKPTHIEEKATSCLICFKAGYHLKPVLADTKINSDIPRPDNPGEKLQMDFV